MIVGLGNPGRRYAHTRHNAGFDVLSELAARQGQTAGRRKFDADIVEIMLGGQKTLLLSPQTFMNRSGSSVRQARDFYRVDSEDLIVVCDDFNLPVSRLRFRARGSSGGQKGLADIIRCLGTEEIARLRIGVGPPPANWDVADFVLSRFTEEEEPWMREAVKRAADSLADWVREGLDYCMNHYNAN